MWKNIVRKKGIQIAFGITACGLISIPLLIWFSSVLIIEGETLLVLLLACGLVGLMFWKYVREDIDMEYNHFAMYSFAGFGMCLLNLILFLNYAIRINTFSETYKISKRGTHSQVILSGNADLSTIESNLSNYLREHSTNYYVSKKVTITFETGLFGIDMIKDCKFTD